MDVDVSAAHSLLPVDNTVGLEALGRRRSVLARNLRGPGPDAESLQCILTIATRVPDHGQIGPWRFVVFEGDARLAFGDILAERYQALHPGTDELALEQERGRFMRAPIVVAVISAPDLERRIPEWEQRMSAGAVCLNMLNAATLSGFGAQWLTEWYAYDDAVLAALDLELHEKIAGFVYIGTAIEAPRERPRGPLGPRLSYFER